MYVNHIFSLRVKRYGSQKKAARMAAEGVKKMSKYVKPVISLDEGMAEGVYAAASGCYTASAYIHQTPENGRDDYRIQVNGKHNADHTKEAQVLTISFNQPVKFVSFAANGATYVSGNDTNTLVINLTYHQNPTDNIGAGDLVVTSNPGLSVTSIKITD